MIIYPHGNLYFSQSEISLALSCYILCFMGPVERDRRNEEQRKRDTEKRTVKYMGNKFQILKAGTTILCRK